MMARVSGGINCPCCDVNLVRVEPESAMDYAISIVLDLPGIVKDHERKSPQCVVVLGPQGATGNVVFKKYALAQWEISRQYLEMTSADTK